MRITERTIRGVIVLRLDGALTRLDGGFPLRIHLRILARRGYRAVLLDCGGMSHVDDEGLDAVGEGRSTLRQLGGDLKLTNVSLHVRRLLRDRGPLAGTAVCDSPMQAVDSFEPRWTTIVKTSASVDA